MKIAFLFPGQGSQKVGMGKDLYEKYEEVRKIYKKSSEISGIDIPYLSFNGIRKNYTNKEYEETEEIGEDLNQTENTQVAISTMSLAILELLKPKNINSDISVGLSLGEYTALVNGGFLSFEDAIKLLTKRGYYMQNKLPHKEYAMLAIIGLNSSKIEEICEKLNKEKGFIVPANYNYSNQTVVSGEKDVIDYAENIFKENGARKTVRLKTSGPFHTKELEAARVEFVKELEKVEFNKSNKKVIKNIDGTIYTENDNFIEILGNHLVNPVRFDKAIKLMDEEKIDTYIEIGPGKALTGFIKKELPNSKVINIFDVKTFEDAMESLKNGKL